MERINSAIVLDTPSCLLRELGVVERLLLLPRFSRTMAELEEKSRIISLDFLDDIIRLGKWPYRFLREVHDSENGVSWDYVRLRDHAESIVECIGFEYAAESQTYFCELHLDLPNDAIRWLSIESMRMVAHTLIV